MSDQTQELTALTQQLSADALATWSDEKRKSFVDTFGSRVNVARYLLLKTAELIHAKAIEKHFISEKHTKNLPDNWAHVPSDIFDDIKDRWGYKTAHQVGGRNVSELNTIATERAEVVLEKLPKLNDAVRILSPEVAKMIEQRAKLLEKGKEILEQSEELAGSLDMDDLDQTMTIAAFQQMVKDREKKRAALVEKLSEIGIEGSKLDSKINKFLYDGLPGLSDAVIKVITDYIERSTALSAMNRRVSEQVQFGDSETAMDMLKTFEKDETKVSYEIQEQFDKALDQLKLAGKRGLVPAARKSFRPKETPVKGKTDEVSVHLSPDGKLMVKTRGLGRSPDFDAFFSKADPKGWREFHTPSIRTTATCNPDTTFMKARRGNFRIYRRGKKYHFGFGFQENRIRSLRDLLVKFRGIRNVPDGSKEAEELVASILKERPYMYETDPDPVEGRMFVIPYTDYTKADWASHIADSTTIVLPGPKTET